MDFQNYIDISGASVLSLLGVIQVFSSYKGQSVQGRAPLGAFTLWAQELTSPASAAISVPGWHWVSWGRQNTALWAADHQLTRRRVKAAHWPIGRPVLHPLQRGTPADYSAVVSRCAGPGGYK